MTYFDISDHHPAFISDNQIPINNNKNSDKKKEHPQSPLLYQLAQEKEWPRYPASTLRARKATTKDLKGINLVTRKNPIYFKYIVQRSLVSISQ
jgi:hypothetical protein